MLSWGRRLIVVLNMLNWLFLAIAMIALGIITALPDLPLKAIAHTRSDLDLATVLPAFRLTLLLCLPVAIAAHAIFTRLVAMIDAAHRGEAFALANAGRLRAIGWWLLVIQLIDVAYGWLSYEASRGHPELFSWQPSLTAWLAILLLFVLARIFEQGAAMRQELDQTI